MSNCKKCKSELKGNYCSNCGRPTELTRIDSQYILSEIGSVLNFEKGILFTIKELVTNPGQSIHKFIIEDRNRLVKPIIFLIVTSLIYTIVNQIFHIEDGYIAVESDKKTTTLLIFNWIQNNYGYANIIMSLFIAIWIKIFFRKNEYNFFEILILLCFVMGVGMLIFSIFGIIEGLTRLKIMQISGVIGIVYCSWAIGQFFGKKKKTNYLKAFFFYLLGMISFTFLAIFIGTIIDLM
ncbi:hypothetical protein MNBD_BACTEROID03-1590 [hydrothermal vent metagenome]|uniref:DUF3667 domain-containing protein n=1 Tax=hydrothermal vent metagenome TaxID=652676 RepID=A0A3B0TNW5_9ZZZZ